MLLILWEASSLATACTGSWRAPSHSGKSSCGRAQVSSAHAASRASALPHRRHALRFCSNSCGLMSRFFAGAASARDALACVGSELARDALRICSNRCGHGHRFLWERPWPRCPSPGAATGQAWRASASARARHVPFGRHYTPASPPARLIEAEPPPDVGRGAALLRLACFRPNRLNTLSTCVAVHFPPLLVGQSRSFSHWANWTRFIPGVSMLAS